MLQDDDCDWFDKDEDELVNSVKAKVMVAEETTIEYIPNFAINDKGSKASRDKNDSIGKKVATVKLREVSMMEPIDAFLFAETTESNFFYDQIKGNDSMERVLLYVKVLVKIIGLELPGFYRPAVRSFAENVYLLDHLCDSSKKFFLKNYKNVWADKFDDFISEMDFLFQNVHQLQVETEYFCSATAHITKILENSDDPTAIARPICQSLITTLRKIASGSGEKHFEENDDLYPTLEELISPDSKKTQNDAKNYNNITEYISIQKYLLREDFMISLREYVQSLKKTNKDPLNCRLFEDVYIMMNNDFFQINRKEIMFVDVLGSRRKCETSMKPWIRQRVHKIKTGSLLCFTTSLNFEDLILATVTHSFATRDLLSYGYLCINVVRQFNIGKIFNRSLYMFESPAFFSPYSNVHSMLNPCNSSRISMQPYLVGEEICPVAPAYLKENSIYTYNDIERFHPLSESPKKLQLNDSQKIAFKNALSQEFCLVQGPPGTGKTHLSAEIVNTLVRNTNAGPIAVIAYTNNSLDKFLLKLPIDTNNIARLGSRSKISEFATLNKPTKVNPLLKRLYYIKDLLYKEQFNFLQTLYKEFDGSEDNYQQIVAAQKKMQGTLIKLDSIRILFQYYDVREKQIIAMTTTHAAKINYLFKVLKTRIVVFEEAAEILESHALACLTNYTQHVLMIGDHKQLKPYTSNDEHSRKHNLNISLFERLINRKMAFTTLYIQYRMRPDFIDLICPMIYSRLENADVVLNYEDIKGMENNFFFLSHDQPDSEDSVSKSNKYECNKLAELAEHLVHHANEPKKIVVLSPYTKQVDIISKKFERKSALREVKITTVDAFQGMEEDIVVLSLVRSNKNKDIGFLSDNNRICVALSRARKGLYIIGNMKLLSQQSKLWKQIEIVLNSKGVIGNEFPYSKVLT